MRIARVLPRAIQAADLIARVAADGESRRVLLGSYWALARQVWDHAPRTARLSVLGQVMPVEFRQRDIYVIAEIIHDETYRLSTALGPSPVIIDAGANMGMSALWFAARYPGATLHCFEPEPGNFALLERNLRSRGARCEMMALGAVEGTIELFVTGNLSDYSVMRPSDAAVAHRVPCGRLERYLDRHGIDRVDLLKLDVEGSELDVLRGLGDRLESVRVIKGECHERMIDPKEFYAFALGRGFRVVSRTASAQDRHNGAHMFELAR